MWIRSVKSDFASKDEDFEARQQYRPPPPSSRPFMSEDEWNVGFCGGVLTCPNTPICARVLTVSASSCGRPSGSEHRHSPPRPRVIRRPREISVLVRFWHWAKWNPGRMAILPVTLLPVRPSCVLLFQITSSAHHGCTAVSDNYMAQSAMAAGDLQPRQLDDWIIWWPEWDEIGKAGG